MKEKEKTGFDIEIPFGAKDSELIGASYHIPDGFYAEIVGNQVVMKKGKAPVSEVLEEEVKKLWQEINTGHEYSVLDSYNQFYGLCLDICEWQKQQMQEVLRTEYEKGRYDMREQMLKDAFSSGIKEYSLGSTLSLDDSESYQRYMNEHFKAGDRVKVIIIKEDGHGKGE